MTKDKAMNPLLNGAVKRVKRLIIAVVGFTFLGIGLAMILLPGPAFIVIPLGLAILATEFVWARNLLKKAKERFNKNRKEKIAKSGSLFP